MPGALRRQTVGLQRTGWFLSSYGHDNLGRRTGVTRANGTTSTFGYDGAGRLASLTHNLAGTAQDVTYGFGHNPAGQIVSRTASNGAYSHAPAWARRPMRTPCGKNL